MSAETLREQPGDVVDIGNLQDSIGFLIRIAQVQTYDLFFETLGEYGLRPGEFSTLMVISQNPNVRQGALAQTLHVKPAHMTKLIRTLEDRGLVRRNIPDHDRRSVELVLTSGGQAFVRRHRTAFLDHENGQMDVFTASEKKTFKRLLRKYVGLAEEENR